jgi:hypothetical protein
MFDGLTHGFACFWISGDAGEERLSVVDEHYGIEVSIP